MNMLSFTLAQGGPLTRLIFGSRGASDLARDTDYVFMWILWFCIIWFVFLMGLMSNYFIGRHVYTNERVAEIAATRSTFDPPLDAYDFRREEVWQLAADRNGIEVEEFAELGYDPRNFVSIREVLAMGEVEDPDWQEIMMRAPGSMLIIDLLGPPTVQMKAGDSFYYGSSPNGVGLVTPAFAPFD